MNARPTPSSTAQIVFVSIRSNPYFSRFDIVHDVCSHGAVFEIVMFAIVVSCAIHLDLSMSRMLYMSISAGFTGSSCPSASNQYSVVSIFLKTFVFKTCVYRVKPEVARPRFDESSATSHVKRGEVRARVCTFSSCVASCRASCRSPTRRVKS